MNLDTWVIRATRKRQPQSPVDSGDEEQADEAPLPNKAAKQGSKVRCFNEEWTELFVVIESPKTGLPLCLICNRQVSECHRSKLERHFNTHADFAENYPFGSDERRQKISQLFAGLRLQQQGLQAAMNENQLINLAALEICFILVKRCKPLSDGEYVKECVARSMARILDGRDDKKSILDSIVAMPLR